jgi:hypothetical protein
MEMLELIEQGVFDDIDKRYYRSSILKIVNWWRLQEAKKVANQKQSFVGIDGAIRLCYQRWGLTFK